MKKSGKEPYLKPWLSFEEQVLRLKNRGLIIDDVESAKRFLKCINYYRFSGYCLAFELDRHVFGEKTYFEQIRYSYNFDSKLRRILIEALEIIELNIRTTVAYKLGEKYGAFAHVKSDIFYKTFDHKKWLEKLQNETKRSKEEFVLHFKNKHNEYPDLPIWVVTEIMSFGTLSMMYKGLNKDERKNISNEYNLQHKDFSTWLHHLTYVRNLCAHHSRIWDRIWSIKALLLKSKYWRNPYIENNNRLFSTLLIIKYLLNKTKIDFAVIDKWKNKVEQLLDKPPEVSNADQLMGIPENWKENPVWK